MGLDPLTRYHRQGNKLANDTAIAATRGITPIFAEQLEATALEVKQQHELLHNLYDFHLEAFAYRANLHAQWKRDEQHEAEDAERTRRDVHALCCAYSLTEVWTPPNQGLTMLQESAWGNTLATVMLDWMRSVEWPVRPDQHEFQSAGISWYELVVSFMYFSKIYVPLRCPGPNGSEVLRVLGSDAEVIALNQKFSDFANTFAIFFKQVTDLVQFPAWPTVERGLVRSLYLQGATIFTLGFRWRPVIPYQVEVATVFSRLFKVAQGPIFFGGPSFVHTGEQRQTTACPAWTAWIMVEPHYEIQSFRKDNEEPSTPAPAYAGFLTILTFWHLFFFCHRPCLTFHVRRWTIDRERWVNYNDLTATSL